MTPTEMRETRKRLGLSQRDLAQLFRLGPNGERSVRRWERGTYPPPGPITLLYELLADGKLGRCRRTS